MFGEQDSSPQQIQESVHFLKLFCNQELSHFLGQNLDIEGLFMHLSNLVMYYPRLGKVKNSEQRINQSAVINVQNGEVVSFSRNLEAPIIRFTKQTDSNNNYYVQLYYEKGDNSALVEYKKIRRWKTSNYS